MNTEIIEKVRKPALIVGGLIATYALLGFIILPKVIESQLPSIIETETGRKASLEQVDFNPFSLEFALHGFAMQEANEQQKFVAFKEFYINVQVWSSIKNMALVFEDIRLVEPYVRLEHLKDDRFNFSDLASDSVEEEPKETEDEGGIFPVIIERVALIQGDFERVDSTYAEPVTTLVKDISLELAHFSTLPDEGADLGFSLKLNSGGTLNWKGSFGVNPVFSTGELEIKGIQYARVWKLFLQDTMQFKWTDGSQLIKFNYEFSYIEEEVAFTLTEGQLLTENLKFTALDNDKAVISIPYFSIDGIDFDLQKQVVNIAKVESRQAAFDTWLNPAGEINYQALFATKNQQQTQAEAPEESSTDTVDTEDKPWDIKIAKLALNKSKLNFTDQRPAEPIAITIAALDLGIKNYHIVAGKLLQMTANQGYLNLDAFNLASQQDAKLIHVPSIKMAGLDFDLQKKNVLIKSLSTSDGTIQAWLDKQGVINYQSLFAPATVSESESVPEEPQQAEPEATKTQLEESPWTLALEEFKIENYALQFKDLSQQKLVNLNLSALNFTVNNFSTQQSAKLPLALSMQVNKKGKINISGSSVLEPFSTDLNIAISQIAISTFEPYINQFARLDVVNGNFNTKGKLAVALVKDELDLNYKGQVSVKKLHTRDHVLNQDFLNWQELRLNGLDFNLQPGKLNIKSIDLDKLYARVTIKKDKTTNIDDVIISAKPSKKPVKKVKAKPAAKNSSAFAYNIGEINIRAGESDFSDYSLILPFVVKLNDLDGDIDGVTSNQKTKTKVDIKGKVFDLSPIDIKGAFTPNLDDLDIGMHFRSLPLPFLSPYMVEFTGNKIEKGKMSLDLMYKVEDKKLTATNDLQIDQLELGEHVDSPNAVDLPLGLAIALLKDKDGKITINMPLQGSMDDPDFSVGPLVLDTFVNLLVKVAASPFSAIGSLLNSDEDFSVVSFVPGSAELSAEELHKIAELSTALVQKPKLSLEVKGGAYTNQDWPAMKEQALLDQLKKIRSAELKKEGEIKLAEYIELSEDEYERLLADLFIKTFPELGKRSLFGTPKLIHEDMGEFNVVAKNMLSGMIKPDQHKLRILALTRARNIARHIVQEGGVEQGRIFILDGDVALNAEDNKIVVHMALTVQ
ncbi:MAG: DUF748 domain-containing protein [Methyloprofundus sp.]|nr:DUF748 domain-containing protein [Methyloprofundus sp.]